MMQGYGLCECGCGGKTNVPTVNHRRMGMIKGVPMRFIHMHHSKGQFLGNSTAWKGGRTILRGYVKIRNVSHPRSVNGYVLEHILVAEKALGRELPPKVKVHHVNETKGDNRGSNLVICENQAYHLLLHQRTRAYKATGNAHSVQCRYCHKWGLRGIDGMSHREQACFHNACVNAYNRDYRCKTRAIQPYPLNAH